MRYPAQGMWAWGDGGWQAATFPFVDDLLVLLGAGGAHGRDPALLLTSREGRLSYHMQSAVPQGQGGETGVRGDRGRREYNVQT